jgi:SHS2 domain-containing protein
MAGSFTVASHTADTAIDVRADSLGELFEWAMRAMCTLMYDLDSLVVQTEREVEIEASSLEELLVDVLSEVLWWSEAEDSIPCSFAADVVATDRIRIRVGGADQDPVRLVGAPIKAVTYHELAVTEAPPGWSAHVVFDV